MDDQIKKCATDLAIKYSNDFNRQEFCFEMSHFKNLCMSYFPDFIFDTLLDLNMITIEDVYPFKLFLEYISRFQILLVFAKEVSIS